MKPDEARGSDSGASSGSKNPRPCPWPTAPQPSPTAGAAGDASSPGAGPLSGIRPLRINPRMAAFLDSSLNPSFGKAGTRLGRWAANVHGMLMRKRRALNLTRPPSGRETLQKEFPQVLEVLDQMRTDSPMNGDYQYERLVELAQVARGLQPGSVLEYGAGTSTAMLAAALPDKARIVSVDELEAWRDKLAAALPDGYRRRVDLRLMETRVVQTEKEWVVHYDCPHEESFDLVYVDGPYNNAAKKLPPDARGGVRDGWSLPDHDVELFWANGIFPPLIMIDGRRSTVRRLFLKGQPKYDLYLRSRYMRDYLGRDPDYFLYHSFMVLKESIL